MIKNMLENKKILLILFLLIVVAGVWYPVSKMIRFEFPSTPPAAFRFRAAIYDPYDLFRGRYVALAAEQQTVTTATYIDIDQFNKIYAVLENDEKGFAKVVDLVTKPEPGKPAVRTGYVWYRQIMGRDNEGAGGTEKTYSYYVRFPFERFYMNERLAPEAERAVMDALRSKDSECVIIVNVHTDGEFTITDLEIDGVPIHEFLKKSLAEKQ